jgi:hypothetical protein
MIVITREVKKKKALASININKKPSPFDTPSTCFMAKVSKVQLDESDNDSDSRSEDEEVPSNKKLIEL